MRPVELVVSGLHSFREEQTIDFLTLQEAGVFGIFGPTGSGKSSLLDAITLALYGKVERAAGNRQGIMNHAEDQLMVSFTFELRSKGDAKRYKVERAYKRSGDFSVRTSLCRFIELGKNERVLADKEREVTAKVEELLGLASEDFTRAVVLPQGKFAEFLSLKGVERRKMLERLFHLEKYGEQLNKRLKTRLDAVKADVHKIEALQLELGQATKKDVKKIEEHWHHTIKQWTETRHALERAEQTFQTKKQIWEWQEEKKQLEAKQAILKQEKPEIEALSERLHKAEEAERLKPYLDDAKRAEQDVAASRQQLKEILDRLEQATNQFQQAKEDYETIKRAREKNVPILVRQIENYRYAEKLDEQYRKIKADSDKKQIERDRLIERMTELQQKTNETEQLLERAIAKQEELKAKIKENTVSVETRERTLEAFNEKQKIISIVDSLQEVVSERNEMKKHVDDSRKALAHCETEREEIERKGAALFKNVETIYDRASVLDTASEKQLKQLLSEKKQLEEEIASTLRHEHALELADQLQAGKACPICGSLEHPNPVSDRRVSDKKKPLQELLAKVNRAIEQLQARNYDVKQMKLNAERLSEKVMAALRDNPPVTRDDTISAAYSPNGKFTLLERCEQLVVDMKSLRQDMLETEEHVIRFVQQSERCERKRVEEKARFRYVDENLTSLQNKIDRLEQRYQRAVDAWQKTFDGYSFADIESKQEEIAAKDRAASEYSERLQKSLPFIDEKTNVLKTLRKEQEEIQLRIENIETTLNLTQADAERIKEEIKEIVGQKSPSQLVKQSEERLTLLENQEKKAFTNYNHFSEEKQSLEKRASKAEEMTAQLEKQRETAVRRWHEMLSQSTFKYAEEVEKAYVERPEIDAWKKTLEEFHEQERAITHGVSRLQQLLGEQSLSLEEWNETNAQLSDCKKAYEEATERKTNAKYAFEDVMKRHQRYMELESDRKKKQKLVDQLGKLEKVFRGNAFVEFLAEEQLMHVTKDASTRLGKLTGQRYAIEVNSEGGFVIRDDANAGVKRPVSSLSGGETFLTSLALALSLSSQIQLRGKYPLEFFFLDEGFGTLDQDLLEIVVSGLEKLHMENVSVGVISHVPELQTRLARKLIVKPAEASGRGSRVMLAL